LPFFLLILHILFDFDDIENDLGDVYVESFSGLLSTISNLDSCILSVMSSILIRLDCLLKSTWQLLLGYDFLGKGGQ